MKSEIRIIAWDDCAFSFRQKKVRAIGVVFRGGSFMDGVLSASVGKDGDDATGIIADAITGSRHYDQLSFIMLKGITIAGFNIVDIKELNRKTKLPVIAVQRKKPDMKEFVAALKKFRDADEKLLKMRKAGKFYSYGELFCQKAGLNARDCGELLKITCTRSNIPEPLRVAHLIASGLSGESRGRA